MSLLQKINDTLIGIRYVKRDTRFYKDYPKMGYSVEVFTNQVNSKVEIKVSAVNLVGEVFTYQFITEEIEDFCGKVSNAFQSAEYLLWD